MNQTGSFVMRADKVGRETMLAQIVQMVARGAAQPRAHPAAGRPGVGLVRAAGDRGGGAGVRRLVDLGAGAALHLRPGRRRVGADHRLPLRARARHADVDHGRRRPRRPRRRADQERRGAGAHGEGRHARRRQDRHADRGQAQGRRRARRSRPVGGASCCGWRPASSAAASIRSAPPSSRQPRSAACRSRTASDFDAPAGKGVTGSVEGQRLVIGNRRILAEAGIDMATDAARR